MVSIDKQQGRYVVNLNTKSREPNKQGSATASEAAKQLARLLARQCAREAFASTLPIANQDKDAPDE